MPEIQEYLPQSAAQEPVGGTSPNLELAGAVGKSIQRFGSAIEEGGDLIHRRQAQEETADIYSSFADQRNFFTAKVQQQTQDGSLDIDKLKEEYDQSTQGLEENISTREGKNYFNRQQARLKGHILQMATAGQAQIATNAAKGKWKQGMDQNSAALMNDPSQFQDTYEQGVESIDQLIKTGGLPEKMRDQAVTQMGAEFSKGAIRGYADIDPDQAKHMLKEGAFDQFLNADEKHQMEREVDQYARARDIDSARGEKAIKDMHKADAEKWGNDNMPKLVDNTLVAKDVLGAVHDGKIDWEMGERWLNMIDQNSKKELKTNPRLKNDLIQRMVDPNSKNPITDINDLMPYVGKGISIPDLNSMNSLLNKTPEGQAMQQGEKTLFASMKSTIRYKNPMTNQYDIQGEQKLAQAMNDYIQAKKTVKEKGGSLGDLVDPKSPLYFGSKLDQYQTPFAEQMNHVSTDRTNKALGLDRGDGKGPPPKAADRRVRQPNESAADYLKRMNLGG